MRIKIAFEIGHVAQPKSKASPEGFTHDWELYVRGADGSIIHRFVEKVVFNLHESFPKPCRVYKEPPYQLKESGYASFNLPIDIYLKAGPRDDPKKYSILYDLDISKTTVQKHPVYISNPSSEFRHKLLEGGGIMINNDGHPSDERTYSQPDSTTKPRPQTSSGSGVGVGGSSSSSSSKKHKIKSDDIKPTSTFENLFGSPIISSKNSPDPKLSNSSSSSSKLPITNSGSKNSSQKPPKERTSEKSSKEKREKKDKSGSTPKEGSKETSTKKSDDKHERREEKRKEKSTTKVRERSKEKSSKRPPSPKPTSRSPKRSASPPRASSSNSNRHESINSKYDEKAANSSSGKKSKKEKRDKSKERERSTSEKNSKDTKHQMQQQAKQKDEKPISKTIVEKVNGSSKKDEHELPKERDKSNKYRTFDTKPPSPLDVPPPKISTPTDSKKSHDKDERKHKHKKKDKNKDKDRKKSKSKDISDSSPMSTSSNRKHSNAPTPTAQTSGRVSNAKTNAMPASMSQSNQSSSEFDDDDYMDRTSPKPDKVSSSNDTNQSMDHLIEPIPEIVTPRSNQTDSPKKQAEKSSGKKSKEPKSNQSSASKEEKKKKRKNKTDKQKHEDSGNSSKRKTQSPIGNDEPPSKFYKKDDEKLPKIKDDTQLDSIKLLPGRTPPVPHLTASPSTQKLYHQSPDSSKQVNLKRNAESVMSNKSKLAHISPATTSSSPSSDDDETKPPISSAQQPPLPPPMNQSSQHTESPGDKQYIAQLKALQQKILTLDNNDELQQVVEMIAATGCYEVTNQTFDFDLCALDRTTVRRLQERLG